MSICNKRRVSLILMFSVCLFIFLFDFSLNHETNTFPSHKENRNSNLKTSFGESPFDSENLFQDSNFDSGLPWIFEGSDNFFAQWSSSNRNANITLSSSASKIIYGNSIQISQATYEKSGSGPEDRTTELRNKDGNKLDVYRDDYLDITFPENLDNGDIITLYILSEIYDAILTVYDEHSQDPPGGYGQVYYAGNVETYLNITLSGVQSPQKVFNINFSMDSSGDKVLVDQITFYKGNQQPKILTEKAYVNQTITIENSWDLTYDLNFTVIIQEFQNISSSTLSVKVNNSIIWYTNFYTILAPTIFSVSIPDFVKNGGDYLISFEIGLSVNTTDPSTFELFIDDAYFWKSPLKNLIKNSEFTTPEYWRNSTSSSNYSVYHLPTEEYFILSTYQNQIGLEDGWGALNQTFYKNSNQSEYKLVMEYQILNNTGVQDLQCEIFFNETLILNKSNLQISNQWKEIRLNISSPLVSNGSYELYLRFSIFSNKSTNLMNLTLLIDNIFLYPLWNSQFSIFEDIQSDLNVGEVTQMFLYYNTSFTGEPITDAIIKVFNNDTKNEWGLDFSSSLRYQVVNQFNGNYSVIILTFDTELKLYNISIEIYHPNFPDIAIFRQINMTGKFSNFTIVEGAYFNNTYNSWIISEDNLPYINDTSKFITVYIWDVSTLNPLENGFIEAYLGTNVLSWSEIFKTSKNPFDIGYYKIFLDTTGLLPVHNFLELNLTASMSVETYLSLSFSISTLIKPIPTNLDISEIEPIYEDSTIIVSAVFTDTFHNLQINNANISWKVLEKPEIYGELTFIFQGFYQSELDLSVLDSGNYSLQFIGQKDNFEISTTITQLQIIAKWNISATVVISPTEIYEGSEFSLSCNFSYVEKVEPLSNVPIDISIYYENNSFLEFFTVYTDEFGFIHQNINSLYDETNIILNISYKGTSTINSQYYYKNITVILKHRLNISIITRDFPNLITGETYLQISAMVFYEKNDSAAANIPLIFSIGSSEIMTFSDETGLATVTLRVPSASGEYELTVTFEETNQIKQASSIPITLNVISPMEQFWNTILNISFYVATIMSISVISYITIKLKFINPRKRQKQKTLLKILGDFDDSRNIQLLMIIQKESGLNLYSKHFTETPIDPILIGGFLQAISTFGTTMEFSSKKMARKSLNELSFYHFRIIIDEGRYVKSAVLLLRSPSQKLKESIDDFNKEIEFECKNVIENWKGEVLPDELVDPIIEKHFNISLSYLHKLSPVEIEDKKSLSKWERIIIKQFQKEGFISGKHIDKFISEYAHIFYPKKELEFIQAAISLKKKNLLQPLIPIFQKL